MNSKKKNGFVTIDMVLAVIGIILFSTLIISLMHNNALENLKIKKDIMAIIYLTETFENIGMADYEEVTQVNSDKFIPVNAAQNNYNIDLAIENISTATNEDILKRVEATIIYKVGNKDYKFSMERVKIKE